MLKVDCKSERGNIPRETNSLSRNRLRQPRTLASQNLIRTDWTELRWSRFGHGRVFAGETATDTKLYARAQLIAGPIRPVQTVGSCRRDSRLLGPDPRHGHTLFPNFKDVPRCQSIYCRIAFNQEEISPQARPNHPSIIKMENLSRGGCCSYQSLQGGMYRRVRLSNRVWSTLARLCAGLFAAMKRLFLASPSSSLLQARWLRGYD